MTQNLKREVRTLKKFAADPTGDAGRCERCDAPYRSERHRKLVFEREEAKRKTAYETLLEKLGLIASNRDAADVRTLEKARTSETTSIDETGEQSASAQLDKQQQVIVPNRVSPVSRIATVK